MRKGNIFIIIAVLVLATLPVFYFIKSSKKVAPVSQEVSPTQSVISAPTATSTLTVKPTESVKQIVPLPTGEDIIRTFFELINEKKIPEAISMMDETMVPDDQTKQAWGVSLNSFSSVKVKSVAEFFKEEWTENSKIYKVVFELSIKPGSNVIWEQGDNIRFINLTKKNNIWKIQGINTGP